MAKESKDLAATAKPPPGPKEPSFHGRLQLTDYMFNMPTATAPRRSPRYATSQSSTASPSVAPTPGPSSPAPSTTGAQKRKAQDEALTSASATTSISDSPSPNKKRRTRESSSYAPPSTYAHLSPLKDIIEPNLIILFVGLNPGVQTARQGHAYSHPTNHFWRLLHSSGLTPTSVPCRPDEDRTLPARFSLGNTNIVARPSRNGAELSKTEMDAGVVELEEKIRKYRPEVVCVVGKSIWESMFRVWEGRNLKKGEFEYGWQDRRIGAVPPSTDSATVKVEDETEEQELGMGMVSDEGDGVNGVDDNNNNVADNNTNVADTPWEGSRIFVTTTTSGLAATPSKDEKERIWKILGDWCVQRRKERGVGDMKTEVKTEADDT
ncbi:DNA glycosylase [Xylariaceae sp. FL1019]|nr:DNA glycosylase [Xylariaceae sp. FL1019]